LLTTAEVNRDLAIGNGLFIRCYGHRVIAAEYPLPVPVLGDPNPFSTRGGAVSVRWLGTAGFEIRHGDHVVLVDPYLTRASLSTCLFSTLSPDVAAITRHVTRADAIVVGHTHFDHVLDVPTIARLTNGVVFGSRSAANLCRADGVLPSRVRDVEDLMRSGGYTEEVGPFELRFFPSAHSKLVLGRHVPMQGDIADCDQVPLRAPGYKCGAVFAVEFRVAGRTIFHLGSAELVEGSIPARETDLLLFTVAGWQQTPRVCERALSRLSPRAVLLSHWDDFFRPIDRGTHALPGVQVPRVVDRFYAASRDVRVGAVPLLGEVLL
jgi:L-ascorbate metabolism protein UlaG (beta-lactamase superfamily)